MNLTWHIVRKDLRRMALPVGLWVALVVATTAAFRIVFLDEHGNGPAEVLAWAATMAIWTRLLLVGELVLGCLLVGALILEDGLRGTNAFWMTRPIPPARLLAAKLTAAALLFVAAPTAGLMTVWFACGLGWQGAACAAVEFAIWQAAVTLPAVMIASLAGTLAEFLFCSVGLMVGLLPVALFAFRYLAGYHAQNSSAAVSHSRNVVIVAGLVPAMMAVLAHQYFTRRTARTWLMVGLVAAATVVVGVALPWERDFWTAMATQDGKVRMEERPEDRAAEIVAKLLSRWDRFFHEEFTHLKVTAPWAGTGFYMPVLASVDNSNAVFMPFNVQEAGERAIGFSAGKGPITWSFGTSGLRADLLPADGNPALTGKLEIWSARARVLGEMPLRAGGEFSNGAVRTRIVGLQRTGEQLDGILVEEHDAESMNATRLSTEYYNPPRKRTGLADHLDCYFLVDRANRRTQLLSMSSLGERAVKMNSLTVTMQRLHVSGNKSWEGAVVVVVRIERDHVFTRPFAVQAITYEGEEKK